MSSRFLLLVENGGGGIWWGFLKDVWSWKTLSQSTDRSERSSPVWGSAQHSTALPPTNWRPKPGSFWGHHRPGDAATSAHFRNGNRKPLGSTCFLPSFLFRSLYAPQYFVGKAATYQHQQSSARVGNGSVRPRGWALEHPPTCLQSTDPAGKGEGRGEYLPPPTASKPPNGSGQSNPYAFIKPVTRHGLWLIFFLSHVCAEERSLWTGRRTTSLASVLWRVEAVEEAIPRSPPFMTSFLRTT